MNRALLIAGALPLACSPASARRAPAEPPATSAHPASTQEVSSANAAESIEAQLAEDTSGVFGQQAVVVTLTNTSDAPVVLYLDALPWCIQATAPTGEAWSVTAGPERCGARREPAHRFVIAPHENARFGMTWDGYASRLPRGRYTLTVHVGAAGAGIEARTDVVLADD